MPRSQYVPVWRTQNLVIDLADAEPRAIVLAADMRRRLPLGEGDADTHLAEGRIVFLGEIEARAHFALDLSGIEAPLDALASPALAASGIPADGARFADLRQLAGRLARQEGALLALARAIVHSRALAAPLLRLCRQPDPESKKKPGTCAAAPTPIARLMRASRAPDPAVIMLVTDGERCPARPQQEFSAGHVFDARRVRRAGREPRGRGSRAR